MVVIIVFVFFLLLNHFDILLLVVIVVSLGFFAFIVVNIDSDLVAFAADDLIVLLRL